MSEPSAGSGASSLWQRAASFAARAHRHQVRRDGLTPYAAHPFRVAMIVRHLFGCSNDVVLAAAMLHDVIEDSDVDYDEIAEQFSVEVADLVAVLTKDMRLPEHDRERDYDRRLAAAPWPARLIKLADVFDNLCDADHTDDDAAKSRLLDRARRAIELARDDSELRDAVRIVEAALSQ